MQQCMNRVKDILSELTVGSATQAVANRYSNVAGRFTRRLTEVHSDACDRVAPVCQRTPLH